MKIWKYESYDDYVKAQTKANVKKIKKVWVQKSTISKIYNKIPMAANILCHGTRNAAEQKYFSDMYPMANIIGTEISYTASDFPMTVQHDFHEVVNDWIGEFDIVYSNSFDHSYDPEKCMSTWANQLTNIGTLCIELQCGENNRSKATDPLELSYNDLIELASQSGLWLLHKLKLENNDIMCMFRK